MSKKPISMFIHCQQQLIPKLVLSPLRVFSYYECPVQIIDICSGIIYHKKTYDYTEKDPNFDQIPSNRHYIDKIPGNMFSLIEYNNILEEEEFELKIGINIILWDERMNSEKDENKDLEGFDIEQYNSEESIDDENIVSGVINSENKKIQLKTQNVESKDTTNKLKTKKMIYNGKIADLREKIENEKDENFIVIFMTPQELFK